MSAPPIQATAWYKQMNPHALGIDIDPLPLFIEHICGEKLKTISIDLSRTPGVGLYQVGEVLLEVFGGKEVGATIEVLGSTSNRSGVDINRGCALALAYQRGNVLLAVVIAL